MPYLIIDLEMSGSEAGYHDIIQIGAVLADDNWKELSKFETLVYPDNEELFDQEAEEVHGISIFDLEEAPMVHEALEDMEKWIRTTLKRKTEDSLFDVICCGQSILNDVHFLQTAYKNLHLKWPLSFKLLDLMSWSLLLYPVLNNNGFTVPKSYSLTAVAGFFKLSREAEQHNALEDAILTYHCFKGYHELAHKLRIQN